MQGVLSWKHGILCVKTTWMHTRVSNSYQNSAYIKWSAFQSNHPHSTSLLHVCACTHVCACMHTHTHTLSLSLFLHRFGHGQPPLVWCTSNFHITFDAFNCHKMTSKLQFQSTDLKITGCKVCQIQWLRHGCNLFFHDKMVHCHSPVTSWCSISPLHNMCISGSFLLILSCKHDSTSTQQHSLVLL
jgi:hypothetical protein